MCLKNKRFVRCIFEKIFNFFRGMFFLESNIEINVHGPLAYHHHNNNNNFSYYDILFIVTQLVSYFFSILHTNHYEYSIED